MSSRLSRWSWLVASIALLQLAGCASFEFAKAPPKQQQPVELKLSGEELSGGSDLPLGVYRVPESQVIISGHQKGQAAGMMFGLIGVAIAHAANASSGAHAVKNAEKQLHFKLDQPVQAAFRDIAADPETAGAFTLAPRAGGNRLLVTPGLVLSFVDEATIRPFVVLKVSLTGADNKAAWTTRYIAATHEPRPLLGPGSWLENDGGALHEAVQEDVRLALRTMAADMTHAYVRDPARLTMLQGPYPHVKPRVQTLGYLLHEDDRYVVYVPRLGDAIVFTGVNIFDRKDVVYRPAKKDDALFKLIVPATAPTAATAGK